ncbi:hypothetical protein AK812_SmicGene40952 [Symbiodinium microadriaticum]|uniref:Uncharacterized protein n=1 Tax=Symbiodinium microadriaticum TaxID=2951 RepID=A0A1Q9C7D7_SYMMI|nr:hypothetical protein AK812_SmicGene40952 [Symbiodinium microadriaticum]
MIAPILALEAFRDHVRNKDVILLIDSEAVQASLVKGYSSKKIFVSSSNFSGSFRSNTEPISSSIEFQLTPTLPTGHREIISRSARRRGGRLYFVRGLQRSHENGLWAWELELLAAVKRRDLKEMRQRLDAARAVNVEEEKVLEASRKLALGEIKEGTKLQDAEMLLRALDEGRAAGLTENQLYTGKSAYLKMQAAAVAESTDMEDFRSVLAVAAEMGLPEHQDLAGTRRRLALLELREAADGTGISKLQQCIQSAKEHGVDKDDIDKGTFRLCVLELQQATVDFDSERLRDAMLEAKERAAPGELFPPAKRKLASIFPEAFTEWMLVELEETLAALDDDSSSGDLRAVLQEAAEAKVEEEDLKRAEERLAKLELREAATMSDLPEIERILNNAQVYGWDVSQGSAGAMYEAASVRRRELQAEERKVDCKQNLDLAVLTLDLNMMRQYIEEAKELGLDKEVIERAEAKYQEYA